MTETNAIGAGIAASDYSSGLRVRANAQRCLIFALLARPAGTGGG